MICIGVDYVMVFPLHRRQDKRKSCPPNTVLLHQFRRGEWAPNISPFPLKLETYLRMAKIPYQVIIIIINFNYFSRKI